MASRSANSRLDDVVRILFTSFNEQTQRCRIEVRLIAQGNGPMGQFVPPTAPLRPALDRAEHPAARIRVDDAIFWRATYSIEFSLYRFISCGNHRCYLPRAQRLPNAHL